METTNGIRFSLQGKLLIPVVIALALFMGSSALYLAHVLTTKTEDHFVTMLSAGNDILVKNIRNATESYKSVMRTISIIPQLKLLADVASGRGGRSPFEPIPDQYRDGVWGKAEELLLTLSDNFPDVVQFNFARRDGSVIASSQKDTIGKVNVSDRKWFERVKDDDVVISEPLISKSTGDKSVVVAAPVHGDAGGEGVIYAIVPCLRVVSDTIRNVKMSGNGYSFIVDGGSGLIVAHNTWAKILSTNMFELQPWMKDIVPGDTGVKKDYFESPGHRRLAVYHQDPFSGWIAVSCISMDVIEEEKAFVRNRIFILTICGAFVAGLIISFVIRSATKDITLIGQFARSVSRGNLYKKLPVRRNDELGDLGDDIAAMVRSLKEHVEREIRSTEERRKEFAALRDALMLTLAGLVESRDANTGQHIRKTSAYVKIITYSLRNRDDFKDALTDEFVDNIIRSAPLHDIGKINVPDAILNKSGKLTDEEFAVMKTHTSVGGQIIRKIISMTPHSEYLREAVNLATYHHERWDGKGYPEGLKGRAIPLSARIMAVADVFDALVSKRAYKTGFPIDKAFAIIREESGTHFDPVVVDAFFAARKEVVKVERHFERKVSFSV